MIFFALCFVDRLFGRDKKELHQLVCRKKVCGVQHVERFKAEGTKGVAPFLKGRGKEILKHRIVESRCGVRASCIAFGENHRNEAHLVA